VFPVGYTIGTPYFSPASLKEKKMAPVSGYILLCALLYENLLILSLPGASLNCVALALLTLRRYHHFY